MAKGFKESHVEEDVVAYLTKWANPSFPEYVEKDNSVYHKEWCVIPEDIVGFIKDTQRPKYDALAQQYGAEVDIKIVERVVDTYKKSANKTLDVLRGGVRDRGQALQLAYFQPVHCKTPEHEVWYRQNRLTIIRQLRYSTHNQNSVDVVLFLNGLPIVTLELKNALTGQYLHDAIKQFINDRDPKEPLFEAKRCLVHFAVSTEKVSMATELRGTQTRFLPFNKALINVNSNGFATSYLWEDVLRKDSIMDLVQNYINVQINRETVWDVKSRSLKEKKSEKLIFPRYHQRRAVQKLIASIKDDGVGKKYLIQHSAGSGKSNTISWLAHRLSDFYHTPADDKPLFNSVIVVTDRRVLNRQIQDSIRQFEQTPGVVEYIDEKKTSQELKAAIESGARVIVTTLQKFPLISDLITQHKDKTYAVIIDEAHSSQTGEAARHLRKALSLEEAEKSDPGDKTLDELIEEEIRSKGDQQNISFFAFTATPKNKTIELFGTLANGQKQPFDIYSMEQAIKEGFILDVLKGYASWKRYYKLVKRSEDRDEEYDKKKTVRLLSSWVDLHDHAIEKKTRIVLEHFIAQTQNEIQGKARAMLVTRSRLHAVRYKRKFDEIMREMKLPYNALVAFSGTVTDAETGEDYTMQSMNALGGHISVPEAFKLPQYRLLIVANMYQTGFDEPMLHTMFVDKKLGGTSTVQTLSRLNRTALGKDSTFVLDFVNNPDQVQADFQLYYGSNYMEADEQTDPNSLYDLLNKIESTHIIHQNELEVFAEIFFHKGSSKEKVQPLLNGIIKRVEAEFDEEQKDEFRAAVKGYIRLYRFLSQIITFTDVQLEKYYVLLSAVLKKMPPVKNELPTDVLTEIDLDSYKLQHQFTTDLKLQSGNTAMEGLTPGATPRPSEEEYEWLSNILKVLNETFNIQFSEEDKVEVAKVKERIMANEGLMAYFNNKNSKDNIKDKFSSELDNELLNFISTKLDLYNKLTEDKANHLFKSMWFNELYDQRVRGIIGR
jgi:type I restriction enzyme R subunit